MTVIHFPGGGGSCPARRRRPLRQTLSLTWFFHVILDRGAELVALAEAEAEAEAGFPMQDEPEAVRALLRLILSPNVRMPLSRLQMTLGSDKEETHELQ